MSPLSLSLQCRSPLVYTIVLALPEALASNYGGANASEDKSIRIDAVRLGARYFPFCREQPARGSRCHLVNRMRNSVHLGISAKVRV